MISSPARDHIVVSCGSSVLNMIRFEQVDVFAFEFARNVFVVAGFTVYTCVKSWSSC